MVANSLSREQLISKINELENKLALAEKAIIDSNNQDGFSVSILEEFTRAIPWKYDLVNDKYIFVGNQLNDFLGYNKKDWVEINSWATKIHEEDREKVFKNYRNALKNKKEYESEYRMIKKNGDICWIHDIVSIIRNDKGEAVELIGYMIDVTERLKIKNELLEKQRFLQTVFDGIQAPMHVIDKDFKVVLTNKKLLDLKGVKQEDIVNQFCYQAYQGINKLCDDCGSKNVFETGKPSITTKQLPLPDNQLAFFDVYSFPIFDENGKVSSVIEMTTDITERRKAELALTESEKNFRLLFEKSPLGIYIAKPTGEILDGNEALLTILGSPSLEATKQINVLTFPPLVETGYSSTFTKCVETKETQNIELLYTSKWDKSVYISSYIIPLLDDNGVVTKIYTLMEDSTKRIQTEKLIKESEERFRSLFEKSADPILLLNKNGFTDCNQSAIELLDYSTKEEFLKLQPWELSPEKQPDGSNSQEKAAEMMELALNKGYNKFEWIHLKKGGNEFPVEVMLTPILISGEQFFYTVWRDISDRKKAISDLSNSEKRFKDIATSLSDWIWEVDTEGKYIYCSDTIEHNLGYTAKEALGKTPFDFMLESEVKKVGKVFGEILSQQIPFRDLENWNVKKNGQLVCLSTSGVPIFDENKTFIGYRGIDKDITEKKQSENLLIKELELSKILSNTKNLNKCYKESMDTLFSVSEIDSGGIYLIENNVLNLAYKKGLSKEFFEQNSKFESTSQYYKLVIQAKPFYKEYEAIINSHDEVLVKDKIQAIGILPLISHQKVIGCVFVAKHHKKEFSSFSKNIIETFAAQIVNAIVRIKAENETKKLNAELEEKVKQRTFDLEEANKELEAFSYSVSHDLRTPLRSIDGFSNLLFDNYYETIDEQGKDFLKRIKNATNHMGELIDDLLKLSRVTLAEIKKDKIDLTKISEDISKNLLDLNPERQIEFTINENLNAIGDKALIKIVLQNFIDNAVKYSKNELISKIIVGKEIIDGEEAFFVKDNGAGFDMEYSSKLFNAFQRLHSSSQFKGNGIGLATVKRIIKKHGGRVWAKSELNNGATFYFTLKN